jgi:hypothetical protein
MMLAEAVKPVGALFIEGDVLTLDPLVEAQLVRLLGTCLSPAEAALDPVGALPIGSLKPLLIASCQKCNKTGPTLHSLAASNQDMAPVYVMAFNADSVVSDSGKVCASAAKLRAIGGRCFAPQHRPLVRRRDALRPFQRTYTPFSSGCRGCLRMDETATGRTPRARTGR